MARKKAFRGFGYKGKNTCVRVIDGTLFPNEPEFAHGMFFRSKKEARRFVYLEYQQKSGVISMLNTQAAFDIVVGGVAICRYVADFTYLDAKGQYHVEDVKGFNTVVFEIKQRLMKAVFGLDVETY